MTVANVFVHKEKSHIVTDGALSMPGSKRIFGLTSKTVALPHLGLALLVRGPVGICQSIQIIAAGYRTEQELRAKLPARLKSAYGWRPKWLPRVDLFIAGVQDGKGFGWVLFFQHSAIGGDPASPFEIQFIDEWYFSPSFEGDAETMIDGHDRDVGAPTKLDAVACRVVDAQKAAGIAVIGGFVQITTVSQFGIYSRILKRWPE